MINLSDRGKGVSGGTGMAHIGLCAMFLMLFVHSVGAQELLQRIDSMLSTRYYDNADIDTANIVRPKTKWTVRARMNVTGTKIRSKGIDNGLHFNSELEAERKATLSVGVSYLGFSLSAALNPAKLMGKYSDYEVSFTSNGKRFGFDIVYQDAHNFTGWHDHERLGTADGNRETFATLRDTRTSGMGMERSYLTDDRLKVKTLNVNAFYIFNSHRFSYPAAFSQNYIQRQSAGSFLLAASGQGQSVNLNYEQGMKLKMTNIGIGAGYGYNYVPGQGWLLHISALPTFIVYSRTSMTFGDNRIPLHYHFPEVIITGRGAVLYQWSNKFLGMSMVYNFTNIGDEENLAVHNIKWRVQTFFGLRL